MSRIAKIFPPSRWRLRFRDKLAICFGGIVLLSTLLAIALSYFNNLERLIHQFGRSLIVLANTASENIDPDKFQSLKTPEQMSGPAYKSLLARLQAVKLAADRSDVPLRYLYAMEPTDKPGEWRYVLDTQSPTLAGGTTNPDFSPLGFTEKMDSEDVIVRAYKSGEPMADRDVKDYPIWGPLLSVAVPIWDRNGRIIGSLGADAPALAVTALRRQMLQTALICLGAGLIVVLVGSRLVSVQVTRPIDALVKATHKIAEGDLDYTVQIASRDELAILAMPSTR